MAGSDTPRRLARDIGWPSPVTIEVDGRPLEAFPGESLATALLADGQRAFRVTPSGSLRGPLCNMGVCFDCVVLVAGLGEVRACMTAVCKGLSVSTGLRGDGRG